MAGKQNSGIVVAVPPGVVQKLEQLPHGINPVIETIKSHFIEVDYTGNGSMKLKGQYDGIIDLQIEYLQELVGSAPQKPIKSLGENDTVVWTFREQKAMIIGNLFKRELSELRNKEEVYIETKQEKKDTDTLLIACKFSQYNNVNKNMEEIDEQSKKVIKDSESVEVDLANIRLAKSFTDQPNDMFYCRLDKNSKTEKTTLIFYGRSKHNCTQGKLKWLEFKKGISNTENVSSSQARASVNDKDTASTGQISQTGADTLEEAGATNNKNNTDRLVEVISDREDQLPSSPKPQTSTVKSVTELPEEAQTNALSNINGSNPLKETVFKKTNGASSSKDTFKGDSSTIHITQTPKMVSGIGDKNAYTFDCSGMSVAVYQASITEIKGMDAITNAANDGLFHGGGVAYYISKAAGDIMNQECKAYIDKHNRIPVSENFVSSPGKMACKGIIHAVGPMWCDYPDKEQCAKDLYKTILNVLKVTKQRSWQSVALPAISSGIFGVPKQLCAEMYVKAFVDFGGQHGTVTYVHFIDVNREILDLVINAHKQWLKDPSCLSFKNAQQYSSAVSSKTSTGTKRSVSTENPSLIKFTGEDVYFKERVFQYSIFDKLKLYVYNGDLLKLDNVDAIVVPLKPDKTGGLLAEGVKRLGGTNYKKELETYTNLREGDVFVCFKSGGMKTATIHVIVSPKPRTDQKTLNQYSSISGKIFREIKFQKVALPLVGSAQLVQSERQQLCNRLLLTIIDTWTSAEKKLSINELHLVNMDRTTTDCFQNELKVMTLGNGAKRGMSEYTRQGNTYGNFGKESLISEEEKFHNDDFGWTKHRPLPESKPPTALVTMTNRLANSNKGNFPDNKQTTTQVVKQNNGAKGKIINTAVDQQSQRPDTKTNKAEKVSAETDKLPPGKCKYHPDRDTKLYFKCDHGFCNVCVTSVGTGGKCLICKADQNHNFNSEELNEKKTCPICQDAIKDAEALPCKHMFCKECLVQLKQYKPECPVCSHQFGQVTGNQPNGEMLYKVTNSVNLPGYDESGTIVIKYVFPPGKQQKNHPFPGREYKGIQRVAFLPDTIEGRKVHLLLRRAFDRRLVFTIGESRTTGKEGVITWNDIHHKTRIRGGPEKFGYPDPTYLSRVKEELAAKGVVD